MPLSERLQNEITAAGAKLRIGYPWWLRRFLFRDVIGITLGRRIYVLERIAGPQLERLIRHELAHVQQVQRLGIPRFLWRYAAEYVHNRRVGLSASEAYARISFEVQARAAEEPYNSEEFS